MVVIRKFEPKDAEAVSDVVRLTIKISNGADYAPEILQPLVDYYSPEKMLQLSRERDCLIAEIENHVVGTVALEGNNIVTFFIHPDHQRKGIGVKLIVELEAVAAQKGLSKIALGSSITAEEFYTKMGYHRNGDDRMGKGGQEIGMEKELLRII